MYCPVCRVLSAVEGGKWGVGIGFCLEDLYDQDERPEPQQQPQSPAQSRQGLVILLINQQQQR